VSTAAAETSKVDDELLGAGEVAFDYLTARGEPECSGVGEAPWVPFERCAPVRGFTFRKGQRHLPGRWWSATDFAHVGYESWLERDHLMLLDFDPAVVALASKPFRLSWTSGDGTARSHIPDFFARRNDTTALVVDCRPAERIKPRDAAAFAATEQVCALLGWDYRVSGALDPVMTGNVRWLAGYRHPRHRVASVAATSIPQTGSTTDATGTGSTSARGIIV